MKKILFICDGDNFPTGAFQFIKLLRVHESLSAKGIFFTPVNTKQPNSIDHMPITEPFVNQLKEKEEQIVAQSKAKFIQQCDNYRIQYDIQDDYEAWDGDLFVKESRFSDLLVIGQEFFSSDVSREQPNSFMQEALHESECPVVIVPETFKTIDRIAVAYDGGKESIFAVKQFCYLFAQFTDLPVEFIYIKNEDSDDIPDGDLLRKYASWHFDSLAAFKLHFDPTKHFGAWLKLKRNVLLVAGSYARSAASNLLNPSFADQVIQNHSNLIFIAHSSYKAV